MIPSSCLIHVHSNEKPCSRSGKHYSNACRPAILFVWSLFCFFFLTLVVASYEAAKRTCGSSSHVSYYYIPYRFDFNTDLVHIQTLTGPSSSTSCCIHGLVLPVHENQLITLQAVTGRKMGALVSDPTFNTSTKS